MINSLKLKKTCFKKNDNKYLILFNRQQKYFPFQIIHFSNFEKQTQLQNVSQI